MPPSKRPLHLQPSTLAAKKADELEGKPEKEDFDDIELGHSGEEIFIPRSYVVGGNQPLPETEDKGKPGKKAPKPKKVKLDKDGAVVEEKFVKVEENGRLYDQSLLRAINRVVFWR